MNLNQIGITGESMDFRFDGKKALVTGAGKGIGRAVAKALSAGGAETYALSRTQSDLDSLKQEDQRINCLQCDVSDWKATRKVVEEIGAIDLLVNNAGVGKNEEAFNVTEEDLDWMININLKAAINISQVVGKTMVERGNGGCIVNVSSQASKIALEEHLAYCATKAALDHATRVMALEWGKHQIRVNCVNPTVVLTKMGIQAWSDPERSKKALSRIPMGKFAEEKDVVHPIMYLLSDKAGMITGATLPVDGGWLVG